jgi:hypothetical protein
MKHGHFVTTKRHIGMHAAWIGWPVYPQLNHDWRDLQKRDFTGTPFPLPALYPPR